MSGILTIGEARKIAGELIGDAALSFTEDENGNMLAVELTPDNLLDACRALRDDERLSCKYFSYVAAVDFMDYMETVYMLRSMDHPVLIELRVKLDRDNPAVPSVTGLWTGANWHEREAYDLFGINFEGHPDLRRLLNREDLDVYPLLKDARPHRKTRAEWKWEGLEGPKRLPGEPPRRERS